MSFEIVSLLNPPSSQIAILTAGPAISAGTSSQNTGTVAFGNSNGVSFGMSNGVITATIAGGGGGGNYVSAGTQTAGAGAVVQFANGNGVTFGMSGSSQITASVNTNFVPLGNSSLFQQTSATSAITSAAFAASNSTVFAGTGTTYNGTNVSATVGLNSAGLNLSLAAPTPTPAQTTQTQPAGNIAGAGFTSVSTVGVVPTATLNSNGLSLAVPNWITTYVAQTTQTQATGGIAGSGFTSTTTAGSVPTATLNSNGLSFAAPAWITTYAAQTTQTQAAGNIAGVGTTFAGTNVSGSVTLNSNGLNLALSAPTPGGGGAINVSAGTTSNNLQSIVFANSNGVSFGLNGSTLTGSVVAGAAQTVQTQPAGNIAGAGFTSTTTAGVVPTGTLNSNGLNLAVPNWITTYVAQTTQTQPAGNIAGVGTTFAGTNISASATFNSNGLNLALSGQNTVAQTVQTQAAGNIAGTGFASTTVAGSVVAGTHNTAGLTLAVPAFITTYVAQTTQTQPAGNIAGVGTTFAGTNISGSITNNSVGLNLALSVNPAGATTGAIYNTGNTTGQSSSSTYAISSLPISGAGIASVGWSGGQIIVSVPAGGGGGDGYNIVSISGNTTGTANTYLSATVALAGGQNVTLSQSSNSISINAPASSSLVGSNGLSISTAGSTISLIGAYNSAQFTNSTANTTQPLVWAGNSGGSGNITIGLTGSTVTMSAPSGGGGGGYTLSDWLVYPMAASSNTSFGQNSLSFAQILPQNAVSMTVIEMLWSLSHSSTSSPAWSHGRTLSYGLYQETNGTQMSLLGSSSFAVSMSGSSNLSYGLTLSQGAVSTTLTTASSGLTAFNQAAWKIVSLPFSSSISPAGAPYYFGYVMSTNTSGANVAQTLSYMMNNEASNASMGALAPNGLTASNASVIQEPYGFIYSASSANLPATLGYSQMSIQSNTQPYLYLEA